MTEQFDHNEAVSVKLYDNAPDEQISSVMGGDAIFDIDREFMGFVSIYDHLAKIIPKHFNVVDLGCSYAAQCFLFRSHKSYVGVDTHGGPRFHAPNTTHHVSSIYDFINSPELQFDDSPTFAICSYVPPWGGDNRKMVREAFENVFVYYPKA